MVCMSPVPQLSPSQGFYFPLDTPLEKAVENVTHPKLLLLLHSLVKDWKLQREPKGIWRPNPIDFKWVWDTRFHSLKEDCSVAEFLQYFRVGPIILSCQLITSKGKGWAKPVFSWNLTDTGKPFAESLGELFQVGGAAVGAKGVTLPGICVGTEESGKGQGVRAHPPDLWRRDLQQQCKS